MLVVCRLLTRPSSVIFSSHHCTVLDYIKCTYPLVSRLHIPHSISIATEFASRALLSCQYAGELLTLGEVLAP
jgi:hypothetical protein